MVNPNEISEMARLLSLMEGNNETFEHDTAPVGDKIESTRFAKPGVSEMKAILENFYSIEEKIITDTKHDKNIREAFITEQKSENSASIGSYTITAAIEGGMKSYDVVNEDDVSVAVGLSLYEAARGIVRILSNGLAMESFEARKLLSLENDYHRCLSDAIIFKHRAKSLNESVDPSRVEIMVARYDAAKQQAVALKQSITDYVSRLG